MSGEELYRRLQSIWTSPENFGWGVVDVPWDELGPRRRLLWSRCAAAIAVDQKKAIPGTLPTNSLTGTLKQIEERVIADRMKQFHGYRPAAAESLGISLKSLYDRFPVDKAKSSEGVTT